MRPLGRPPRCARRWLAFYLVLVGAAFAVAVSSTGARGASAGSSADPASIVQAAGQAGARFVGSSVLPRPRLSRRDLVRPILDPAVRAPLPFSRWPRQHLHLVGPEVRTAVVGGFQASQGEFGFMALVIYQLSASEYFLCSATVVSPNVLLTAAHCVVDPNTGVVLNPAPYEVITGVADWTDTSLRQTSTVSQVMVAPGFDRGRLMSDAALLILSAPISAPSVQLPTSSDLSLASPGAMATMAGWGETYKGSGPAHQLGWADTVIQRDSYCEQFDFGPLVYRPGLKLCTVNWPHDDVGVCHGDSGGPLLAATSTGQPVEVGIASYAPPDCNTVDADYYTSVAPLSSWMEQVIQSVAPSSTTTSNPSTTPLPTPPTSVPSIPQMTLRQARSLARITVAKFLGRRARITGYGQSCKSLAWPLVECHGGFWSGPNNSGTVIDVYWVHGSGGQAYWTSWYSISWASAKCWSSRHRSRCKVHTRSGFA
jgi:hypothetical protein